MADGESQAPAAPVYPPSVEPVGDAGVDQVMARLEGVSELPVGEHNALYTGLHDDLLTELNAELNAVPATDSPTT